MTWNRCCDAAWCFHGNRAATYTWRGRPCDEPNRGALRRTGAIAGHVAVAAVVAVAVDPPAQRKVIQNDLIAVIDGHDVFGGRVSLVPVTESQPQIPYQASHDLSRHP